MVGYVEHDAHRGSKDAMILLLLARRGVAGCQRGGVAGPSLFIRGECIHPELWILADMLQVSGIVLCCCGLGSLRVTYAIM